MAEGPAAHTAPMRNLVFEKRAESLRIMRELELQDPREGRLAKVAREATVQLRRLHVVLLS